MPLPIYTFSVFLVSICCKATKYSQCSSVLSKLAVTSVRATRPAVGGQLLPDATVSHSGATPAGEPRSQTSRRDTKPWQQLGSSSIGGLSTSLG